MKKLFVLCNSVMYISYMAKREELSDIQWVLIEPLLPKPIIRADRKGRPRRSNRKVMNDILWILRSRARWYDLPERFPPYQHPSRLLCRKTTSAFGHLGCILILIQGYY